MVSVVLVSGAVCQEPETGVGPPRFPLLTRRYTVKGDGFSVLLPSRPALTTSKVARKDGKERTKRFLTITKDSVVYTVDVVENLKPEQPLEEFIAESKAGVKYDPAAERNLIVDGFPGKEYSSQTETTTTVMQFLATKDRLFRFAATGPAAAAPVIKEFFSSIKLGEKTEGIDVSEPSLEPETGDKIYNGKDVDVRARFLTGPNRPTRKMLAITKLKGP